MSALLLTGASQLLRLGVRNALMGAAAAAAGVLIIAITVFIILQVRFFSSKAEMD